MVEGIFNIDKPTGPTSHDIVNRIRRLLEIRRVGHAGTLDPLATGVLLICIGRATRLVEYLTGLEKRYLATVRLGQETDTFDAEGKVISESDVSVTEDEITSAVESFRGVISQQAPRYSAIKVDGEALYKRSRRGEPIEPPVRRVTIHELEILDWTSPDLTVDLVCSSGTYIRSFAHDLGRRLGCGGYLLELHRSAIGDFSVNNAVAVESLTGENWAEYLLPVETAVAHLPQVEVSVDEAYKLYQGLTIPVRFDHDEDEPVSVFDDQGRFVGVVSSEHGSYRPRKILYKPLE